MNVRKITSISDLTDDELSAVLGSIDAEIAPADEGDSGTRH